MKAGEGALVFLFAAHALGGVRLLMIQNLPWYATQRVAAAATIAGAAALAMGFLVVILWA